MKRRLKHASPVGSNLPTLPESVHLCECYDCLNGTCTDPTTGFPVKGRLLSPREIRRHEALAQKRSIASAKLNTASRGLSVPEMYLPNPSTLSDMLCSPTNRPEDTTCHNILQSKISPSLALAIPRGVMSPKLKIAPPERPHNQRQYNRLAIDNTITALRNMETFAESQAPFTAYKDIIFCVPPTAGSKPLNEHSGVEELRQIWDLKSDIPANKQLLVHQDWLYDTRKFIIDSDKKYGHLSTALRLKCIAMKSALDRELVSIEASLKAEWERQRWIVKNAPDHYFNMNLYMYRSLMAIDSFFLASYLVALVLHLLCGLSMIHCKFLLGAHAIMSDIDGSTDSARSRRPTARPTRDIRIVEKIMMLDTPCDSFVSCPKCFYLYPYRRGSDDLFSSVPERCTNRLHPDSDQCSRRLRQPQKVGNVDKDLPTREFLYQGMKQWVGWMYSRPDIEKILDEDPTARGESTISELSDIWDGSGLREFKGPDGSTPFYRGPGNEARLVFSLNMDGFNPYTNKEAGKKVSTGGIYMVCLNLPPSIRYKEENMYLVGVIPGPQEPSLHEINYLLKPLVDELVQFWDPGYYYSHTKNHPQGRWIRCAVVPLVCDLPAARQMSGAAHHGASNFCSYCWQNLEDINNLDYKCWKLRTVGSHRNAAQAWLDAETQEERETLYDKFGVRWSELLRLPYWDPLKFTVIDPMHCFYLRMLSRHCREVWGMDEELPDATSRRQRTDPSEKTMRSAHKILRHGTAAQLKGLKVRVLKELCIETSTLNARGRKDNLLARLLEYRHRKGWPIYAQNTDNPDDSLAEEARYLFRFATKSTIKRLTKEELICVHRVNLGEQEVLDYRRSKTAELRTAIQAGRKAAQIIDNSENVLVKELKKSKATAVLGKGVLREVRLDMERTNLPSWVSPAPKHPGEKKWGKLTASNWRAFGLINLPITLIRLWGNEPTTSRKRQMLDNYMHLVTAIKIATLRTVTPKLIAEYQEHMHLYLTSLLVLYPKTTISPYQHLALHFGSFLERFGPTHAWHCFPFERYNHRMQQIPTNKRFGKMEGTMFHGFRLNQIIRTFFNVASLPASLRRLVELYHETFSFDQLSVIILMDDALPYDVALNPLEETVSWDERKLVRISVGSYSLLKGWLYSQNYLMVGQDVSSYVFPRNHIIRLGQKFTTSSHSLNNSHVFFQRSRTVPSSNPASLEPSNQWLAGRIDEIFSHTRICGNRNEVTQTFAVVTPFNLVARKYQDLDPYRLYPTMANRLYSAETNNQQVLVPMSHIICHFAHIPACLKVDTGSLECIVAYPLNI